MADTILTLNSDNLVLSLDSGARGPQGIQGPTGPTGVADTTITNRLQALTKRPTTVIPFGDSITQSASISSNGVWQFGGSWPELASYNVGLRIIRNAGIAGNTIAQMLARLQTDVIAYAPDCCIVAGLTNDLVPGMSNATLATALSAYEAIVKQLMEAGILPIVVCPPTKDSATTQARMVRPFLYRMATFYGLPLIDLYRASVDSVTGNWRNGYSTDGTHPLWPGVDALVAEASPVMASLIANPIAPYLSAFDETTTGNFQNLIRNGCFSRVSSGSADSWTTNVTNATKGLVAATPTHNSPWLIGNTFTYNKTVAGAVYALAGSGFTAGFSVGDKLLFSGRMKVSGLTPGTGNGSVLSLDLTGSSAKLRPINLVRTNGDWLFSTEMMVPTGTTSIAPTLYVQDVGVYEINALTVFNQTAADAIWMPGL